MMPFVHSFKFANNVPKNGIGYIAMFSKIALHCIYSYSMVGQMCSFIILTLYYRSYVHLAD